MDSCVLFQSTSLLNSYEAMAFENKSIGLWVIVKYDASFYLGTLLDIVTEKKPTKVHCLEKKKLQMENLPKWKNNSLWFCTKNISFIYLHQYQQLLNTKEQGDMH